MIARKNEVSGWHSFRMKLQRNSHENERNWKIASKRRFHNFFPKLSKHHVVYSEAKLNEFILHVLSYCGMLNEDSAEIVSSGFVVCFSQVFLMRKQFFSLSSQLQNVLSFLRMQKFPLLVFISPPNHWTLKCGSLFSTTLFELLFDLKCVFEKVKDSKLSA